MGLSRPICIALFVSVLLTVLFWGPLWCGYGFIGGDLYPYFFPQKAFLADRLHAGEFPLWNNLTGFGYPVLGESQTGAAYPPHVLAYYFLDVNTAYNVEHLAHYLLCFLGTWLFARRIGMQTAGALLTSIVFTYGWFPSRACLEWAIVTGGWLPACLWCVESFVQTRYWRYAIGLSVCLGLQLLPGHFHLAFITQLLVIAYGAWRTCSSIHVPNPDAATNRRLKNGPRLLSGLFSVVFLSLLLATATGFLLASVQLLPAWELKTRSSRAVVGGEHEPSYGHLPPLYITQLIAPWLWYNPREIHDSTMIREVAEFGAPWHWFGPDKDLDELLLASRFGGLTNILTNKAEAHLYCGLIPLGLAVWWLLAGRRHMSLSSGQTAARKSSSRTDSTSENRLEDFRFPIRTEHLFWLTCGLAAVVYATGWLLPIARYIPGFNFFRGPGRYGIVTTMAVAVLAGRGLDQLLAGRQSVGRMIIVGCVFWSTICDLWLVSRMVYYAEMIPHPAIAYREESPIRKLLNEEPRAPRLYAPFQNACNLLGVSCLPVYLGIAPGEYSDRKFAGKGMPRQINKDQPALAEEDFSSWLNDSGVTHILAFYRLDESSWDADLIWQGMDPMISRFLGRFDEPLYLYKLRNPLGRATLLTNESSAVGNSAVVKLQREANSMTVDVDSTRRATLLVRDLAYPGWEARVDDQPVSISSRGVFRAVDVPEGHHRITFWYRPWSFKAGLAISLATLLLLAALAHLRFWHQAWLDLYISRWHHRPLL